MGLAALVQAFFAQTGHAAALQRIGASHNLCLLSLTYPWSSSSNFAGTLKMIHFSQAAVSRNYYKYFPLGSRTFLMFSYAF